MRILPFLATLLAATLSAAARPRLVVVISVDQFSADLMARWGKDLPGGLGRLYREGSTFLDAYHDHGYTETGPGHSVLLTGRHPMHTGITENAWWDRAAGRYTYCVDDPAGTLLGVQGTPAGPANLDGSTLGEWLAAQVKGSRSFAVSGKDRSAILMAGHRAQGVYWFSGAAGFTSSEAYARTLPGWLVAYNTAFLARTASEALTWSALDPNGLPGPATWLINGQALRGKVQLAAGDRIAVGNHVLKLVAMDSLERAFHTLLLDQSTRDNLTGLGNRRTTLEELQGRFELGRRNNRPLSVIMCDLDNFKLINDSLGHGAGDFVLSDFGERVRRNLRNTDIAGRIGGEEFLLVLPETDMEGAMLLADRLRMATGDFPFELPTGPITVTCSLGVAQSAPEDRDGGALMARADGALYTAKRQGRNRVVADSPKNG